MHRILSSLLLLAALSSTAASGRASDASAAPPGAVSPISAVLADRDGDSMPDSKGGFARVRGTVTIPPDVVHDRNFQAYIQDDSGGISLFHWDLQMELAPGDVVEATGKVQQYRGAVQLAGGEVRVIGKARVPAARAVTVSEAGGWAHMGTRVRVEGVTGDLSLDSSGILELQGDDGATITLYVPSKMTGLFDWPLYASGTRVSAVGVLSIFKQNWPYDSNFQLVVTSPQDLRVLEPPPAAWKQWLPAGLIALGALLAGALAAFQWLQSRHKARQRELATLAVLSTAMAAPDLSEEQLARRTCETLTAYGIVEAAMVQVFDERGYLCQLAISTAHPQLAARLELGTPQVASADAGSHEHQIEARVAGSGLKLLAILPLLTPSGSQGFLVALSPRSRRASAMQDRTLLAAVKLLAMTLENCRVQRHARVEREQLQQLVITDDLTKLYNRRFLNEYLRVQIPLAHRRGSGLAFLTIDIDGFKVINDTWGHDVGDRVLVGIAGVISEESRSSDLTVRVGGEEFLVVIAGSDMDSAHAFAERLRSSIEARSFDHVVEGKSLSVTVSIGVSVFGIHGTTAAALLGASDQAMFSSKRNGRNQVTLASADATRADPRPA